jgi:hypothetical protein
VAKPELAFVLISIKEEFGVTVTFVAPRFVPVTV